jgi:hypothetical protein
MTEADRVVDLYRRHARAWAAARGTELRERGWFDRFAALLDAGATEHADCGDRTVWLARRRGLEGPANGGGA